MCSPLFSVTVQPAPFEEAPAALSRSFAANFAHNRALRSSTVTFFIMDVKNLLANTEKSIYTEICNYTEKCNYKNVFIKNVFIKNVSIASYAKEEWL